MPLRPSQPQKTWFWAGFASVLPLALSAHVFIQLEDPLSSKPLHEHRLSHDSRVEPRSSRQSLQDQRVIVVALGSAAACSRCATACVRRALHG